MINKRLKMRVVCNLFPGIVLSALSLFVSTSCDRGYVELVDPVYRYVEVSCGYDFEIPVLTGNWNIEYVKDEVSGRNMSDKDGKTLTLDGNGTVEASNGWLELSRNDNKAFVLSLKENFDPSQERRLSICVNSAEKRDYVNFVQRAGSEYGLIKWEYEEMEDLRAIYTSDEDCTDIELHNHSSEEVWMPTDGIFKDVVGTSEFDSDDYGAFAWMPRGGVEVPVPDLVIDREIRGDVNPCLYKKGVTSEPLIKDIPNGSAILMRPHSTLRLSGEVTYCRRVYNYTFTIQNMAIGTRFEVKGVWTQIIPISRHTISY